MSEADERAALCAGRVFVAGHNGMVGAAIVRRLRELGCNRLLTRGRAELDLADAAATRAFFAAERPEYVFMAAAKVGGIHANNTWPADFIRDNLAIATNVIDSAHRAGTHRLLFLGSSCIYPKAAPQPLTEASLLTGPLEPTNEPYAIAKIAGIKLCESFNRQYGTDFRSVMPTNLYGPCDNFDLETSHVLPALLRRFHEARMKQQPTVTVWGSGSPRREFLHVDDLAEACVFVMSLPQARYAAVTRPMASHVNVGTGTDLTIAELATLIAATVGYEGRIEFDPAFPDGTPRKLLDVSVLRDLGWQSCIGLAAGLRSTYDWFRANSGTDSR